ncbi:hypothetical protein RB368 [Rhodopirellula baltica SH 1]|uniref:Uncharacterized protein n=1 Tax=Rhodopirellula baltica (strain DSM 10527 / NCIMB 13988 / SH1) TaxID=243090 RepID=Q7UYV3_RHOBA|nr:hypothetical protein RB368 [Rhodopirellula baltica SH 1]
MFQYASPPTAPKRCNDQSLPTHSATLLPCSRVIAVVFSSNHSQPIGPRFWGYGEANPAKTRLRMGIPPQANTDRFRPETALKARAQSACRVALSLLKT